MPAKRNVPDLSAFPGGDLVQAGLRDLDAGTHSDEALLVLIARPRLEGLGFEITVPRGVVEPFEHALYESLESKNLVGAHAAYNALIQRIVSFANAYTVSPKQS